MAPVDLNDKTKNWLKAVLALKHLKNGLLPFVDTEVSTFHNNLIVTHGICTLCSTNNAIHCPNGVCNQIRAAIVGEHFNGKPMWKNTDATKWSSNGWEVAKCYLPSGSNKTTSSADTDCTGILSLCLHCKHITTLIDHHDVKDTFKKNRDNRNALMHSGSQELSDAVRSSYIQDAVQLLSTFQTPVDRKTQDCIDTLNEIDSDGWLLTKDDIVGIMKDKVEAVRLKQEELEASLKKTDETVAEHTNTLETVRKKGEELEASLKKTDETVAEHTNTLETYKEQIRKLEDQLRDVDSIIKNYQEEDEVKKICTEMKTITKKNEEMETRVAALETKVTENSERLEEHSGRLDGYDGRLDGHDGRLDGHDGRLDGHDGRLDGHDERLEKLEGQTGEGAATKRRGSPTGLRDHLIKTYEGNYSEMCLAPPTDMWTDFVEHYHEPNMRQIEIPGKQSEKETNIEIKSYRDIFYKGGKQCRKIYVKGEAGRGKSMFCQRMVKRWCEIHSRVKAEYGLSERDPISDEQQDEEMLNQFEFLFYIELRYSTKLSDIESMIKENILDNNPKLLDQLTDVLNNDSEKCLILLDGLDEWSSPEGIAVSQFVTPGLPDRKSYDWTILTTTRPCKLETIRPKPRDIDQMIELSGLTELSVSETINSVVDHLNKNHSKEDTSPKSPEECLEYLQKTVPSEIQTLPIILKYLVCIWFEGGKVGKSKCDVYAAMIDLFLRYGKADEKFNQNTQSDGDTGTACNDPPLCLQNQNRELCQKLKIPLINLSKLAFHTLFCEDRSSSLVFDIAGMSETEVDIWLKIGLLSKDKVISCAKNKKKISFPHKSIQEFLAAAYMSMHTGTHTALLPTVKNICGSVNMILEMSQVFVFLSGMAPTIVTTISRHIAQVASADGDIQRYRSTVTTYAYLKESMRVTAIQSLMNKCIRESVDTGQTNIQVHIQDLIMTDSRLNTFDMYTPSIEEWFRFNKSELISLSVDPEGWKQLRTVIGGDLYREHLSKLEKIEIQCKNGDDDDDDDDVVVSIIKNSINRLRVLSLTGLSLKPSASKQLFQCLTCVLELQFTDCKFNLHEIETLQTLQGIHMKSTTCNHCTGPYRLDLSQHTQLERLHLQELHVSEVQINTTRLEQCTIDRLRPASSTPNEPGSEEISLMFHGDGSLLQYLKLTNIVMKHEQLEQLMLFVTRATGLGKITLNDIRCSECGTGCTCCIDLSQHTQLWRLALQKLHVSEVQINTTQLWLQELHVSEVQINTTRLEWCTIDSLRPANSASNEPGSEEISLMFLGDGSQLQSLMLTNIVMKHEQLEQLMLFVTRATGLLGITLSDIKCSECGTGCTCCIDLSQHTQLQRLKLRKLHVSEVQINTTRLVQCKIDSLRPANSASNEPGSEEISLMFHGDGSLLRDLILTNIVMKHEQLEQLMLFVTRATGLRRITLNDIKCSECGTGCTWRLDLSQHTQLRWLKLQKLHVSEVQINTTQLWTCTIDSLRPASSAPNEPGSEVISLMFLGDGSLLQVLILRNIVMKHEQLEQLMFVTRNTGLRGITLSEIKCSECGAGCTCRLDLSQHTQLERLWLQKLHVSEVQINTTWLWRCTIDSLRPASSASNEPGSEDISLMFHGDGSLLQRLTLTNIVLKHEQLEQLMQFLSQATGLWKTTLDEIKCSECSTDCSVQRSLYSLATELQVRSMWDDDWDSSLSSESEGDE